MLHGHKNTAALVLDFFLPDAITNRALHSCGHQATDRMADRICCHPGTQTQCPCMHMESAVHILSHTLKDEKMEWEEVKGIEWVAVGEKDGERGRGRVGVSGTWLSG